MAYTDIDVPSDYFSATLYTGDGSADQDMTGAGFKPDFLWIKRRNASERHVLTNAQMGVSNGAYKWLDSAASNSSFSGGTGVASFDADGFTIKTSDATWNASGSTYVFWSWKANGGTVANNTDGDLTTSIQVNQTAGCSIITYTGLDPIEPLDLGHGLGKVPEFWFIKSRQIGAKQWGVYHKDMSASPQNGYMTLHTTNPYYAASTWWRNEAPTTTVIKTGEQDDVNRANSNYICYAWTSIQGFSKFGKYVGNGNANGAFVYTGFKPAWVMVKDVTQATNWEMFDHKRNPSNVANLKLGANLDVAENGSDLGNTSQNNIDMLSNGFKMRTGNTDTNVSGDTYIYMAFAENPFVTSTGTPTTAR